MLFYFLSRIFAFYVISQFIQNNLLEIYKDDSLQDINDHAPKFNTTVYNKSIRENFQVGSEIIK